MRSTTCSWSWTTGGHSPLRPGTSTSSAPSGRGRARWRCCCRSRTVLLATGAAERGWALHSIVLDRTDVVDNPLVRADVVLATGPSALGGTSAPDQILQAEELLALLPAEEHRRRIQLLCWAAHHRLNLGQLDPAMALLAEARHRARPVAVVVVARSAGCCVAARLQVRLAPGGAFISINWCRERRPATLPTRGHGYSYEPTKVIWSKPTAMMRSRTLITSS